MSTTVLKVQTAISVSRIVVV